MPTATDIKKAETKLKKQLVQLQMLAKKGQVAKTVPELVECMAAMPQGALAWLFGVSSRTIRDRVGMPRNEDNTYNAQDALAWHVTRLQPTDGDPLLGGFDSPALERFREARADREELELSVRRGQLVNLEEFNGWFDLEIAGPLRKNLQKLQRKYGNEAFELISNGLQQAVDRIKQRGKS